MRDSLLEEIASLHRKIHKNDPQPANVKEQHAQKIMAGMQSVVMDLVLNGVNLRTIELSLLYFWLRMAVANRDVAPGRFNELAGDLGSVISRLTGEIQKLDKELEEPAHSPEMAQMGSRIQQMRGLLGQISTDNLSQQAITQQTERANTAIYDFTVKCLQDELNPGILESTLLYYWLRASVTVAEVPETLFQKMEYHWPTVKQRVDEMVDDMLNISDHSDGEPETDEITQLVIRIDEHVKQVGENGGGTEKLLLSVIDYMSDFKKIMDSSSQAEMNRYCDQYSGFSTFAQLLENMAKGIQDGRIPVPNPLDT